MDHAFLDLAPGAPVLAFHTPVAVGSKRERTAQGYLKIRDVVIARTGVQDYHGSEIPVEPGPLGYVVVERSADDLFSPEAIASFEDVPIVDEHPRDLTGSLVLLDHQTTLDHLIGTIKNVRRGEGDQAHCLVADAVLYSDAGIALVEAGKRQVSAGYTATYERIEPGRGRQTNFRGNHLAIVHRGRCGAECAFGDQEHTMTEAAPAPAAPKPVARRSPVPAVSRRDVRFARVMHAVRTGDEDLIAAELAEAMPVEEVAAAADPLDEIRAGLAAVTSGLADLRTRMDAADAAPAAAAEVAAAVEEVAEAAAEIAGEALPDELTTDAAWRDTVSRAEILAPGLAVPTGDAVASPKARGATIVAHQRRALGAAFDAHPDSIRPLFGVAAKPDFDKMPATAIRGFFIAASENARRANAAAAARPAAPTGDAARKGVPSPAEINTRNAEKWKAQR